MLAKPIKALQIQRCIACSGQPIGEVWPACQLCLGTGQNRLHDPQPGARRSDRAGQGNTGAVGFNLSHDIACGRAQTTDGRKNDQPQKQILIA